MSDEKAPEQAAASSAAAQPAPKKSRKSQMFIVAGLAGGAAVGSLVVGPMVGGKKGASTEAHASEHGDTKAASHEPAEIRQPHLIENLVLNPAGSRGTRFLLLSVGIVGTDAVADDEVRRRDAEARDRVVQVMGAKTVEDLVDVTKRDGFRKEIAVALDSLLGKGKVQSVLFPQFVIQ
jgi:flagellar FliL protein